MADETGGPRTVLGKYELGRVLGSGFWGKVRVGKDTTDGEVYAVKIIGRQRLGEQCLEDQLKRGIAVLVTLRHKNIVSMREVLQTSGHIYIVQELVEGGEVIEQIVQQRRLNEDLARKYFQQLILAVRYCHEQNFAHRKLELEHLRLDGQGNVKLKLRYFDRPQPGEGDPLLTASGAATGYEAQEAVRDPENYDGFTADVWSCGVILYVMLSGHHAFADPKVNKCFDKIERGEYTMSRHFSEGAKDLIAKILVVDATRRFTINEIIAHPWFQVNFDPSDLTMTDSVIRVTATHVREIVDRE